LTTFTVSLAEPVDLLRSLEVFRRPGDDLIDRRIDDNLIRTAPTADGFTPYLIPLPGPGLHNHLSVVVNRARDREHVEHTVSRLFVAAPAEFEDLVAADKLLARLHAEHTGIRPVLQHDLFTALVRSISAQQINLRRASTIRARLAERYGDRHEVTGQCVYSLNAGRIAEADPLDIRALQFTLRKAESVIEVAQEIARGLLTLADLRRLPDDEVIARLIRLKGIGVWSAEWILARTLGRPRVVAGDLGVRKAVGRAYLDGQMPSEAEVRELTAHWGTSASIAQALVLHALAAGTT
jgi:DNA-3-methyladenine glycosylase II